MSVHSAQILLLCYVVGLSVVADEVTHAGLEDVLGVIQETVSKPTAKMAAQPSAANAALPTKHTNKNKTMVEPHLPMASTVPISTQAHNNAKAATQVGISTGKRTMHSKAAPLAHVPRHRGTFQPMKWVDTALVSEFHKMGVHPKKRRSSTMHLEWIIEKVEAGSNATIVVDNHNCTKTKQKRRLCSINLQDRSSGGVHFQVMLGKPLDSKTKSNSRVHVEMPTSSFTTQINCNVCGYRCWKKLMGQTFIAPLPKCPIQTGAWGMDLPFTALNMTYMPVSAKLELHNRIVRGDGSTVVKYMVIATF